MGETGVSGVTRACLPRGTWAWTCDLAVFFNEFLEQALGSETKLHFDFLQNSSNLFYGTECIRRNATDIIGLYSFKMKAGKQFCSLTLLTSLRWLRTA